MQTEQLIAPEYESREVTPNWVTNATVLWVHRGVLGRTAAVAYDPNRQEILVPN